MGKVVLGVWIAAIAFGGFWFGYYQEGANESLTVEVEVQGNVPGIPVQVSSLKLYSTGSKLAIVGEGTKGNRTESARIIVDMSKKKALVILDEQKMILKLSFDLVDKSDCKRAKAIKIADAEDMERQADTRTIAGHRCHGFVMEVPGQMRGTLWFTYDIPLGRDHIGLINRILRFKPSGELGEAMAASKSKDKRPQISSFDYFPIPMAVSVRTPQGRVSLKVTSITRGKVDKSVFEVPSGYHELNLDQFLSGMFKNFRGMQQR